MQTNNYKLQMSITWQKIKILYCSFQSIIFLTIQHAVVKQLLKMSGNKIKTGSGFRLVPDPYKTNMNPNPWREWISFYVLSLICEDFLNVTFIEVNGFHSGPRFRC